MCRTATVIKPLDAWHLNTLVFGLSSSIAAERPGHASFQQRGAVAFLLSDDVLPGTQLCFAVSASLTAPVLSLPWDEAFLNPLLACRSCNDFQKRSCPLQAPLYCTI
jgi:hypothetical protein